jgi:hypothetical protein
VCAGAQMGVMLVGGGFLKIRHVFGCVLLSPYHNKALPPFKGTNGNGFGCAQTVLTEELYHISSTQEEDKLLVAKEL